jgi:hypothetical protein
MATTNGRTLSVTWIVDFGAYGVIFRVSFASITLFLCLNTRLQRHKTTGTCSYEIPSTIFSRVDNYMIMMYPAQTHWKLKYFSASKFRKLPKRKHSKNHMLRKLFTRTGSDLAVSIGVGVGITWVICPSRWGGIADGSAGGTELDEAVEGSFPSVADDMVKRTTGTNVSPGLQRWHAIRRNNDNEHVSRFCAKTDERRLTFFPATLVVSRW